MFSPDDMMKMMFGGQPVFSKEPSVLKKQIKEMGIPDRFIDKLCVQYVTISLGKEGLENMLADAHFMQILNKFTNGGNRPSKEQLLKDHFQICKKMKEENPGHYMTNSTSNDEKSGNHICGRNLTELENIYLSDMEPDKIHYGMVLRCTALANTCYMSGAHYPVEDDNGECVSLSLYNMVPRGQNKANKFFGKGDQIYILEPYMKLQSSGNIGIRVDNMQNIKIVKKNQMKRKKPAATIAKQKKSTETEKLKTNPEKWKDLGNTEFRQKNFEDAIVAYERALVTNDLELKTKVLSNMALCYFKLDKPHKVLEFSNKCLKVDPKHEKCIFRKINALSTLREHKYALKLLKKQKKKKSKEWKDLRKRVQRRLAESEGIYSRKSENRMNVKNVKDVDNYVGPVQIRFSSGKGRGMFATEDIPGRKLIIFEKGIYVHLKDHKNTTLAIDFASKFVDMGSAHQMLIHEVLLQSQKHAHINQRLSYLYNGYPESMTKIPDMNIYRTDMVQNDYQEVQFSTTTVNGIIRKNTFGFQQVFESECSILYLLISFINSCANPRDANAVVIESTPGVGRLIALRHICAEEEIIIDYAVGRTGIDRENAMKTFDIKTETEI